MSKSNERKPSMHKEAQVVERTVCVGQGYVVMMAATY